MTSLSGVSKAYKNAIRKHTKLTKSFLNLSYKFIELTEKADFFPVKETKAYEKKAKSIQKEIDASYNKLMQIAISIPKNESREKYRNSLYYMMICHRRLERRLKLERL